MNIIPTHKGKCKNAYPFLAFFTIRLPVINAFLRTGTAK